MAKIFADIDIELWEAADRAASQAGISKRTLIAGTIAHLAGINHPDSRAALAAWRNHRKTNQK